MPGMRLDFLRNTSQRIATGKSMPLKQVEAILLYGTPEQRAKVVQKILPNTYTLCLTKSTHHILLSMLEKCDGLIRVQMLYNVRRKILDLSLSPVGNVIVQEMLEKLPPQQKREIAEMFVLNVETDEVRRLCEHSFGNHVAQKLIEHPSSLEVVEERFMPYLNALAVHLYGQRVVAKYMETTEEGWRVVVKALFGKDEDGEIDEDSVNFLFKSLNENITVSALLRHPMVPLSVKDAICAHLCEYAEEYLNPKQTSSTAEKTDEDEFALPDFGNAPTTKKTSNDESGIPRHHHAYVTVFENADLAQRKEMWESLLSFPGLIEHLVSHKTAVAVAVAAFKTLPDSQEYLWSTLMKTANDASLDIIDVAQDSARTMLLRAVIEARGELFTTAHRRRLAESALTLSQNPVSSPVLQKMLEYFSDDVSMTQIMLKSIKKELHQLVLHSSASYLIQSMLQYGGTELREELEQELLRIFTANLPEMLSFAQGSRVMQKLLAYASDAVVSAVADTFIREASEEPSDAPTNAKAMEDEENEEKNEKKNRRGGRPAGHYAVASRAIPAYAQHQHACYALQALLLECGGRGLDSRRVALARALKPAVLALAVSPWAGRVVLDAMLHVSGPALREAVRNVVSLKAEARPTNAPLNPTLRHTLRRGRSEADTAEEKQEEEKKENNRHPRKKLYRTLKK
ncbi:putative pumilio/PUF RNA binding protein 7 [Trypanosoma theileri]|uniref:Putative pumilio/PUF RNA binding protein 7 n=1 Tax=Trypanosoma theileri TaxID=67003 RepID=A0A1X0NUE8_9TRYP|nr:putative pumilio/PUF RNA binding protein 7 [Trypanosoma theileri]ORC88302.1 putative pumilio/PUF RNA binding protein 7 [Trypanosoma theileri]